MSGPATIKTISLDWRTKDVVGIHQTEESGSYMSLLAYQSGVQVFEGKRTDIALP